MKFHGGAMKQPEERMIAEMVKRYHPLCDFTNEQLCSPTDPSCVCIFSHTSSHFLTRRRTMYQCGASLPILPKQPTKDKEEVSFETVGLQVIMTQINGINTYTTTTTTKL